MMIFAPTSCVVAGALLVSSPVPPGGPTGAPFEPPTADASPPEASAKPPPVDDGKHEAVSVLSLEGDNDRGTPLTVALRQVLQRRGHQVLGTDSFTEVKLALGCSDYETVCLSGAPAVLAVDAVVYGTIRKHEAGFLVELFLVIDGEEDIAAHVSRRATSAELEGLKVHGKAQELAELLWPMPRAAAGTPTFGRGLTPSAPAPLVHERVAATDDAAAVGRGGKMPIWAKASFIAGGIDSGLSIVAVVATSINLSASTSDVRREAQASLSDAKPENDIDGTIDLCRDARTDLGGGVKNAKVAAACRNGELVSRFNQASFVYMGVALGGLLSVSIAYIAYRRRERGRGTRARRWSPTTNGAQLRF